MMPQRQLSIIVEVDALLETGADEAISQLPIDPGGVLVVRHLLGNPEVNAEARSEALDPGRDPVVVEEASQARVEPPGIG